MKITKQQIVPIYTLWVFDLRTLCTNRETNSNKRPVVGEINSSQYSTPKTNNIKETPSRYDSLIAQGLQKEQYIGIGILLVGLITIIGFFSRRFEYALIFALTISIILIVLLLII